MAICRRNLPQLFAVANCRGYLSWVCLAYVSKPFFCVSKSFFFVNNFFLTESKHFLYVSKTLFIYLISLLTVFLFYIAVASYGRLQFYLSFLYWKLTIMDATMCTIKNSCAAKYMLTYLNCHAINFVSIKLWLKQQSREKSGNLLLRYYKKFRTP